MFFDVILNRTFERLKKFIPRVGAARELVILILQFLMNLFEGIRENSENS